MVNRKNLTFFFLAALLSVCSYAASESEETTCLEIKSLNMSAVGEVSCDSHSHHYIGASKSVAKDVATSLVRNTKVQIGSFNLFQVGSPKTEYKDLEIVAKIINNFDVVSAVELVPNSGVYKSHNDNLIQYYREELAKLQELERSGDQGNFASLESQYAKLNLVLEQYELPGYVKLLIELRKIDASWSLLISPAAEGSDTSTIKELTGFYYRASKVKPITNEFCKAESCTITFNNDFYGKEVDDLISRRPFMASFMSGKFDFTLIATHIVYNPPSDENLRKKIVEAAFGVDDYTKVEGLKSDTYARFAEVKHIVDFTNLMKKNFEEKDIFILGDFNLNASEAYWKKIIPEDSTLDLQITEATSVAQQRVLSDGTNTNGTTNNYDHIILDKKESAECGSSPEAKIYNFIDNSMRSLIDSRYLVRSEESYVDQENGLTMYYLLDNAEKVAGKIEEKYTAYYESRLTIKRGELVPRFDLDEKLEDLKRKVFEPQVFDRSYYRYVKEIISDHLPVYINCSTTKDLD